MEIETGRRFTYAELNHRAVRLANFMHDALGVQAGDRVSVIAKNSIAYLDLFYGLAKIGAIFAPFNWRLTARELVYMVKDLEPKALICEPEFAATLAEMRPEIQVEHYISLRGAEIEGARNYEAELENASTAEPERPDLDGESPYCILYTSGTTGTPKGAILPHRQVLFELHQHGDQLGLTEHDVSPVSTPMFHAGGLFVFPDPAALRSAGALSWRVISMPSSRCRSILEEKCTVILGVPTMFQMWMDSPLFRAGRFQPRPFLHQRRRALPDAADRGLATSRRMIVLPPGLWPDRSGPELFQHDRRRIHAQSGLGRQTDLPQPDAPGRPDRRQGYPAGRRPASC